MFITAVSVLLLFFFVQLNHLNQKRLKTIVSKILVVLHTVVKFRI